MKNIIGEGIPDNLIYPDEVEMTPENHKQWAHIWLARMRPLGRVEMFPRSETLDEGLRRWFEHVSKHNDPRPLWERHAFWALSAMVATEMTVAEPAKLVDRLEGFYLSAIANWVVEKMDKLEQSRWDAMQWAVYHDLKHAGLLRVTDEEKANKDETALFLRAVGYGSNTNPYYPSEAHAPDKEEQLRAAIAARNGVDGEM